MVKINVNNLNKYSNPFFFCLPEYRGTHKRNPWEIKGLVNKIYSYPKTLNDTY